MAGYWYWQIIERLAIDTGRKQTERGFSEYDYTIAPYTSHVRSKFPEVETGELHLKTQSVPHSKHALSQLYKPVS